MTQQEENWMNELLNKVAQEKESELTEARADAAASLEAAQAAIKAAREAYKVAAQAAQRVAEMSLSNADDYAADDIKDMVDSIESVINL